MKKIALMALTATAINLSAFAASADFPINPKPWENFSQDLKVINICNLTDQQLSEIMKGEHPEIAVEFSAHTSLPVNFFLKGDVANLTERERSFQQIEIKQTFYARYVTEELILSSNLTDWKSFLDFFTGNSSVGVSIQDGRPSIFIGAEINRRT